MNNWQRISCLLLPLFGGCAALQSDLTSKPSDWADYNGRTVTVRGSAGNSTMGPIVRFSDGGYVALLTLRPDGGVDRRPWGIDGVLKPVIVTGKIVPGKGFREEDYVLQVETINVPPPDEVPTRPVGQGTP